MVEPTDTRIPPGVLVAGTTKRDDVRDLALDGAMDRYARGEDTAFDELYVRGAPRVHRFLLRLSGSRTLADDLTQETFLRVHRARGSFGRGAAAVPWILAIGRNVFRDHVRRARARPVTAEASRMDDDCAQTHASPETRGDEALAGREMLEIVRSTLSGLPVLQREAFVLLRFEGLSVAEAAQIVGTTEGALKVRAFRAYEALRKALGDFAEGER
ncbi:MAG TPA: RNA polymerase sigma factor [Polyangiaceae bacterium]|nr:RNA polymerase sigma factor [Polyangiaceae bacterium]